jgi:multiple sugar transport system ATP-binding protein
MKDGSVVQQGTPDEMYNHPKNLFTAGFIGSPQINTFDCIVNDGAFRADGVTLPIPPDVSKKVKNGQKVTVGVRPSDFTIAGDGACLTAKIDGVETLGDAYLVYLKLGAKMIVVKIGGSGLKFSETLSISVKPDKVHAFDPQTGDRL